MVPPKRPSIYTRLFQELFDVDENNPNNWSEDTIREYEVWRKEQNKDRMRGHYEERVVAGTVHQPKRKAQMSEDELLDHRNKKRVYMRAFHKGKREGKAARSLEERRAEAEQEAIKKPRIGKEIIKPGPAREPEKPKNGYKHLFYDVYPDFRRVDFVRDFSDMEFSFYCRFCNAIKAGTNLPTFDPNGFKDDPGISSRRCAFDAFRTTSEYTWKKLTYGAKNRGLSMELTFEQHSLLVTSPCFYCGEDPLILETRFGIDRVDNSVHYIIGNCVTACWFCNRAKNEFHVEDFIRGMCNVASKLTPTQAWQPDYKFVGEKGDCTSDRYCDYRCRADRKGIEFKITRKEFDGITSKPCHYCGRSDKRMGCDRVNNAHGYTQNNVASCCFLCNKMKGKDDVGLFVDKAAMIFNKWCLER
jgi:hypothetical protein